MTVFRTQRLPTGINIGSLIVPEIVLIQTKIAFQGFIGPDGPHEGLVYWLGRRVDNDSVILSAVIPNCDHSSGHVMASEESIGITMKLARQMNLAIVAQVHSHPGKDTRHSDGDDKLVLMPFEGMFSVVIGEYGKGGITIPAGLGLHQFQKGRWIQINKNCKTALMIVPTIWGPVP